MVPKNLSPNPKDESNGDESIPLIYDKVNLFAVPVLLGVTLCNCGWSLIVIGGYRCDDRGVTHSRRVVRMDGDSRGFSSLRLLALWLLAWR